MDHDGTYGGIVRSEAKNAFGYYNSSGGQLTVEMLNDAFKSLERMDESNRQWEREFWDKMRPHNPLLTSDVECYVALYRLYQSSRSPISKPLYDQLMGIVKSRGIEV